MVSIILLALQLTFGGYIHPYPLPTTDVFVPRPFPFEELQPNGF